jgi:hypothetical protein
MNYKNGKYAEAYKSKFQPSPELLERCKKHLNKEVSQDISPVKQRDAVLFADIALIGIGLLMVIMGLYVNF